MINAVLDEECLVPTSCMRACTAVITEIAHNKSPRENEKYRAEIHFISRKEWLKELKVMLADLAIGQGPSETEFVVAESDAAVAYDKIRAVYPFLPREEIRTGRFDVEKLIDHPTVSELLGTSQRIAAPTSEAFISLLKGFIDSNDKAPGRKKETDVMEYWPLIKVAKVFLRSRVLESGPRTTDHGTKGARRQKQEVWQPAKRWSRPSWIR